MDKETQDTIIQIRFNSRLLLIIAQDNVILRFYHLILIYRCIVGYLQRSIIKYSTCRLYAFLF